MTYGSADLWIKITDRPARRPAILRAVACMPLGIAGPRGWRPGAPWAQNAQVFGNFSRLDTVSRSPVKRRPCQPHTPSPRPLALPSAANFLLSVARQTIGTSCVCMSL